MQIKLLFILIIITINIKAQITSSFTVDNSEGCGNLTVTFTNTSTFPAGSTFLWDFGNGNTSNQENPNSINYVNVGTYTISLTVSNGGESDTYTLDVVVHSFPEIVSINSTANSGCVPIDISFTGQATEGDGAITNWEWHFGDGSIGSGQTSSHNYTIPGPRNITLNITDVFGCTTEQDFTDFINLGEPPDISFSGTPTSYCSVPKVVDFSNSTTSWNQNLQIDYSWNFGDGGTSTQENPSHTYNTYGNFDVVLTATDESGCSNSLTKTEYINLASPIVDFEFDEDIICKNTAINFTNLSNCVGIWSFGDGSSSSIQNPVHIYNTSGEFDVTLTAFGGYDCEQSITKQIYVEEVIPSFETDPLTMDDTLYWCELPFEVDYTSTATATYTSIISAEWHLNDTTTQTGLTVTNSYEEELLYPFGYVKFYSEQGCMSLVSLPPVNIVLPKATFTVDTIGGCVPLDINFTFIGNSDEPITDYHWDFGDGTTSSLMNPSHTYQYTGVFVSELVITNSLGCQAVFHKNIYAGEPQHANFIVPQDTVCASDTLTYINLSTDTNLIDLWHWSDYVNGYWNGELQLNNDTGLNTVILTVYNNFCKDTAMRQVYVNGPIVKDIYIVSPYNCDTPLTQQLSVNIIDADSIDWNFGDGTTLTGTNTYTLYHTFPSRGYYYVTVKAYGICEYVKTNIIHISDVDMNFSIPDSICNSSYVLFADSSHNAVEYWLNTGLHSHHYNYSYLIGDTLDYYATNGVYNVEFIGRDHYGCMDTVTKPLTVVGPYAGFTADVTSGCWPLDVQFTDTSQSIAPIAEWFWDFGNGNTSITQNSSTTYLPTDSFTIQLTVTDNIGCSNTDSIYHYITTSEIDADLNVSSSKICLGDAISYSASPQGSYDYNITFGDNGTSVSQSGSYSYSQQGMYDIQLIVDDGNGCKDTAYQNIVVQNVIADFDIFGIDTCAPIQPVIVNNSVYFSDDTVNFFWDFGNNYTSIMPEPEFMFVRPDDFTASLTVTTSDGMCSDTKIINFSAFGPYGELTISDDSVCVGQVITYEFINQENVANFKWDFGDSGVDSLLNPTSHFYNYYPVSGEFFPSIICDDGAGCQRVLTANIFVHKVIADFNITDTVECSPLTLNINNYSEGTDAYNWDFGNGVTSTVYQPNNQIYNNTTNDIVYTITLIGESTDFGCTDTAFKQIIVHPLPIINVGSGGLICLDSSFTISSSSLSPVVWSPGESLTDSTAYTTVAQPTETTTYTATAIDNNGCVKSDTVTVVVQDIPNTNMYNDTTIIVGEVLEVISSADQENLTYNWAPNQNISCTDCPNPNINPLEETMYYVTITDSLGCYELKYEFNIGINNEFTIDIPDLFTPNGDGDNDRIYVRGWGIEELIEFSIYNRWGEKVYTSTDLYEGWDGTYKGKPQNIDSYAYYAKVKLYNGGGVLEKKGTFTLIR